MRIVSLLPSATEIVCGLGMRECLVGVSHECDYPLDVTGLPRVTQSLITADANSSQIDQMVRDQLRLQNALYSLDQRLLVSLEPDVIVTQSLCDVCAVSESEVSRAVRELPGEVQVVNLQPNRLSDLFCSIQSVGEATNCMLRSTEYVHQLECEIQEVRTRTESIPRKPSVVFLEWLDPPYSAGHWSPEIIELAGGHELIGKKGQRSQTVRWEQIVELDPDVMVVACCGLSVSRIMDDIQAVRCEWETLRCVQNRRVYVVDGSQYFNRPGPRLIDSLQILAHAIHPRVHPLPNGLAPATNAFPSV